MVTDKKSQATLAQRHIWTCSCCGQRIAGLPLDVSLRVPDNFLYLSDAEKDRSFCTSDFCVLENADGTVERYIRCVTKLPVPALEDDFTYGVWMSVSQRSWDVYQRGFQSGQYEDAGCFGYLGNNLSDFTGCFGLEADIRFEPGNARPSVVLHDADHPLVKAQRNGIGVATVEAIVAGLRQH